MIDTAKFKPKTVYVIYIASTPEKVWQALTDRELSQQYFHGSLLEIEPKAGGKFAVRFPDGRVNVQRQGGRMVAAAPARHHLDRRMDAGAARAAGMPRQLRHRAGR